MGEWDRTRLVIPHQPGYTTGCPSSTRVYHRVYNSGTGYTSGCTTAEQGISQGCTQGGAHRVYTQGVHRVVYTRGMYIGCIYTRWCIPGYIPPLHTLGIPPCVYASLPTHPGYTPPYHCQRCTSGYTVTYRSGSQRRSPGLSP